MPLTAKGEKIESAMKKEYGGKKGESVFYASRNAGKISGVDSATKSLDELIAGASAVTDRVKAATDSSSFVVTRTRDGDVQYLRSSGGGWSKSKADAKRFSEGDAERLAHEFDGVVRTDGASPTPMGSVDKAMRGDGDQRATLINTALEMEARANKHRDMTGGSTSSDHGLAYKDLMAAARFFRKAADDASWLKEAERAKTLADKTSVRAMTDEPNGGAKKTPQIVPRRADAENQHEFVFAQSGTRAAQKNVTVTASSPEEAKKKARKEMALAGAGWKIINHYENADGKKIRHDSDTLAYGVSGKSRVPMAVDNIMVRDRIDRLAQGVHSLLKRGEAARSDAREGQRVKIKAQGGMKEFHGKTGRIVGKEGGQYRVKLDTPVDIPGVGSVSDDLWDGNLLQNLDR